MRITIETTPQVKTYLQELVATGLFGRNASEAAERLVAGEIIAMIGRGELKLLQANLPERRPRNRKR